MIPELRRRLPEARLPFERPSVLAATVASALTVQVVRRSPRLGDAARELLSGALSLAPAMLALRGGELAAYHGAEHVSIGTYEHGEKRAKEHERCGSHLIGPLLAASAVGNALASRAPGAPARPARTASSVGAVGVAVEVFAWMTQHPAPPAREGAREARARAAAPARDGRADAGAARGRRGGASRPVWSWSMATEQELGSRSASRPRSSTSRSRRCGRATTPTPTSTTRARRCSGTAATRAS